MAVKLEDLAKRTGLSKAAVSMALRNHPRVSVETQKRVQLLAAEMGYEVNTHGRGLSTAKSETIGVLVPNTGFDAWPYYYLDLLLRNIRSQAARAGYDVLMADVEQSAHPRSGLRRLVLQQKIDGLIVISSKLDQDDRQILADRKFPVTMVHATPETLDTDSLTEFSYFFTDNITGGALAAEHLVKMGCRKVLCFANSEETPEMYDRRVGFSQRIEQSGQVCEVHYCHSSFVEVAKDVSANIDVLRAFDGVFCMTDIMACAFIQTFQRHGIVVPDEIRVVGYDDIEIGTYWLPKLTTIRQPGSTLIEQAIANLIDWIEHPQQAQRVHLSFPPELVVRESA